MLSWALAFFIVALIAAIFGFSGIAGGTCIAKFSAVAPPNFACPEGWTCKPLFPTQPPASFVCPEGWSCTVQQLPACGGAAEIAKILFVVFVVLFLVSLVAGLLRRP